MNDNEKKNKEDKMLDLIGSFGCFAFVFVPIAFIFYLLKFMF